MGKNVKRLFTDFQPKHYVLDLSVDKAKNTFHGSVIITGHKSGRPSQRLTFHQNALAIIEASITKSDKKEEKEITVDRINHHGRFDEVRLHTTQKLYPGAYTVKLKFKGKITRQMNGIYPCLFEQDGVKKQLIATQFESHHAREVFPCIDEPQAKATFDLILHTPPGETVVANTPIKAQTKAKNELVTAFETSPHMSTYLLAFVFGELAFKEKTTTTGIAVRTYATSENVGFTDFALETAIKVLEFYEEYFGIPYPLAKCDMIALPDFASGAMENWGCITYREQALLVDPKNTSLAAKQYVAMVVAHELAHQWFGNLVTMRWWTDLWLNEGFASWIEYLALDHFYPEWQMWTQFVVDEQQRAFKLDALQNTHPVEVGVKHPDEIRTIFDTISYSKGASVIQMLHEYLGPEPFRDGLRHYLKRHAYNNTDTVDLWTALEEISKKPVRDFMHAWTSQPGFPIVDVKIEKNSVTIKQERFFVNPETTAAKSQTWPIALLAHEATFPDMLDKQYMQVNPFTSTSLKLNRNQSGFFRTVYNPEHLEKLGQLVEKGKLSPLDRLGILSDLFESAKAGKANTVDALKFLRFFKNEDNNAVWDVIASAVTSLRSSMDDEKLRDDMKPYIRDLVSQQLARLGWEPKPKESHFDQLLRPTILGLAAGADEPSVIDEITKRFKTTKKSDDNNPDVRGVIYTTAMRHGDKSTFDKLFKMHEATKLSEERVTLTAALTSAKQPELIKRSLDLIKTESVRLQDVSYWVAYSFMNRFARDATWTWMQKNWKWLSDNLGSDLSFYRFPIYAANAYSNPEFLAEYEKFFIPKISPAFERSVNQGIEILTWQSAWRERDLKKVKTHFKSKI